MCIDNHSYWSCSFENEALLLTKTLLHIGLTPSENYAEFFSKTVQANTEIKMRFVFHR